MKLNKAQNEAVLEIEKPCLVLAGAGSGKTRVIIEKIIYLNSLNYNKIIALTFTNKAAKEMQMRLSDKNINQKNIIIATFHTLGLRIIKKEYKSLNIKKNFSLLDENDSFKILKDNDRFGALTNKEDLINLKNKISFYKNNLLSSKEALTKATTKEDLNIAMHYKTYQEYLLNCSLLDFDDLIYLVVKLFLKDEKIRKFWQEKLSYLLVDEYQDTNDIQYHLIKILTQKYKRFTLVGDDDQSIYAWRGAKADNIKILADDFKNLKVIKLEENYRSCANILHAANLLIKNNPHIYHKKLKANLGKGENIRLKNCLDENQEANFVISDLLNFVFLQKKNWQDFAILYRANHQAKVVEKELILNKIPYKITGAKNFFDRLEIKDAIFYLRFLLNHDDDSAFLRIINSPKRGIGQASISKIAKLATKENISFYQAVNSPSFRNVLSSLQENIVLEFLVKIKLWRKKILINPIESLNDFFKDFKYSWHLNEQSKVTKTFEMRKKNFATFIRILKDTLAKENKEIAEIIRLFSLDRNDQNNEQKEKVQLMTFHAAKGLEFKCVYLVGLEEGILPHQNSIDLQNIEEERRLAYVGITRAKEILTLSFCQTRRRYGENLEQKPSRFLDEIKLAQIENLDNKTKRQEQKKNTQNFAKLAALLD